MADPLSMAASIAGLISLADTLFRHTYKFGRTATGAKKEIQALATEINSFSGILRNLEALADELEAEGQAFEPAFQVDHLIECRKIFDKIERQVIKALNSFNSRSRWEGVSRQLKWPFSALDTRDLLQQLSRCKDSITLATSADTMRNLQLCLMKQREQGETLFKMAATLEKIEVRTAIIMDPRKQLVLDFFMPPKLNPQANLDLSLKLRQPATGEWFTQSFAFTEWLQSPDSRLWLNGTAGGGKTVLAGAMIQKAIVRSGVESDVAVAFFFCDYKQDATLKSVNIIGALASQLAIQRDDSFELLQEHYQELHPARGLNKPADVDELARVTASMCNLFSQVIIVVDGLDECGDAVFQALETLCDLADFASTTSMALLSRNEVEIRQALEGGFKEFIIEAREEDLKIYVRAEMERRIRTKQLDIQNKTIKDEIQTELVSRANGMFRWVVCQLDYLGQLLTDADRRQALYELPPTLSETYLRLLQRINKRPLRVRKLVQKCLSFIAEYPTMAIEELCVAVSVPETIGARMDQTNTVTERDVALCCSSLIRKSAQDENFEFAHFSVKEFLQDETLLQTAELGAYRLVESEGRALIALQCLRFLQVGNIDDKYVESSLSGHDLAEGSGFSSFFSTASRRWLDLTRDGLDDPSLLDAAVSLFQHNATLNFRFWIYVLLKEIIRLYLEEDLWNDVKARIRDLSFSDSLPPLHIASALNIPEICSFLIQAGARANASSPLGTPLLLAEVSFLSFLEDLSGEYPGRDRFYFDDILPISSRRNKTIDCLISSGGSFDHLDGPVGDHSVLLSVAIIGCHFRDFDPFITMLDHGHIPTHHDTIAFGDCLKSWPKRDDRSDLEEALLRLLSYLMKSSSYDLDWGFDLGNNIWLAAVTLGLKFTNDTSLTDSRISLSVAALVDKILAAMDNDDAATLQLCLKDGRVGVNYTLQRGVIDGTLLHQAVSADALECTRLLLELGGDPEVRTNTGTPTLHCCAMDGEGGVLKLLVEHGLSLLVQSSDSGTLWHLCASSNVCELPFLEALFSIDPDCYQKALLLRTKEGLTPTMLALMAFEEEDNIEQLESKALLFLHYCHQTPGFWDNHESLFMLVIQASSKKVFQLLLKLNPESGVIKPGNATPLHILGVNPTKDWLDFLTKTYSEALQLRFEDQLPLESYIERTLKASKAPTSDVIQVLSPSEILRLKNSKGITPWESVCNIKDQFQHCENKTHFLSSGWAYLDRALADLLDLGAMEAYEDETGQCGVYLLLACSWTINGHWTVIPATLEQAIQSSNLWDPTQDVVVSYLKSMIRSMNTSRVQILTKYGADIHQRENGTSSIEFACEAEVARHLCSNDRGIAVLECLLDHSRPERIRDFSTDDQTLSILHRIAMESPPKLIEWLLRQLVDKGADLNAISPMAPPRTRESPLTWHLKQNSILCAEVLLELGANPLLTGAGVTNPANAFASAVEAGSLSFLEKLHSLSVNRSTAIGWKRRIGIALDPAMVRITGHFDVHHVTLCHLACVQGNSGALEFLLQRQLVENIDSPGDGGFTALQFAAKFNQVNIIETLVSHEASVNLQSGRGLTALHFASYFGNADTTRVLLQLGALNLVDKMGRTASTLARAEGHDQIAEIVDRHFESLHRLSPESVATMVQQLGIAIEQGNLDECQRLFANGCPVDKPIPGRDPKYPLLYALVSEKIEIGQWLLDNGANVLANGGYGWSLQHTHNNVVEEAGLNSELLPLIPTIFTRYHDEGGCWLHGFEFPLHFAAWNGHKESLRVMLDYLAENSLAIGHRSNLPPEDVVSSVVNRGWGLQQLESRSSGMTPLHVAVWKGFFACAQLLLENGADPDELTAEGECPLDLTTDLEMTALLLQHGASPITLLTDSFDMLLNRWGAKYDALMKICRNCMRIPGTEARDALDSSAPSFILEFPGGLSSLAAARGTLPTIASHGNGYGFNYVLWTLPQLSAFLLNSEIPLETFQQFPWHWMHRFSRMNFLDTIFNQFHRRFGDRSLQTWLNLQPDRGWSPLCRAASRGSIKIMENLLEMDANLDFEGCPLGSALMIASACGRLEAVQLLIRRGAAVSYNGRIGPINVFSVARSRKVKSWLLVERFNDRLRLHESDEASNFHPNKPVNNWSGIVQARFRLVGWTARHGAESTFDYARRLCQIKQMGFTDGIVPADGFIYPQKSPHPTHSASSEVETAAPGEQWFDLDAGRISPERGCGGLETSQMSASAQMYEGSCREVLVAIGAYHNPGVQGFTVNIGVENV